jgi:hypothetical protein
MIGRNDNLGTILKQRGGIQLKIRELMVVLRDMTRPAYIMLRLGVILSLIMVTASLIFFIYSDGKGLDAYNLLRNGIELFNGGAGVLLLCVILSAVLESKSKGK